MSQILVSVVCTTYNHEQYIKDTLEGFVSQETDFEYEVLVHDDASTDRTADIIREYEKNYPDIIHGIYQRENQYSKNVNILNDIIMPKTRGKIIAYCEGDDYWCDNHKLQLQVTSLLNNPECVACTHNSLVKNLTTNSEEPFITKMHEGIWDIKDIVSWSDNHYHTSSLIVKKEFSIVPEIYKCGSVGDYPLALYLCFRGGIYYIDRIMSVYRYGTEGSWTKRVGTVRDKIYDQREQEVQMLKRIDKEQDYRYHEIFNLTIRDKEFYLAMYKKKYKLALGEYKDVFKSKSLKEKLVILLKMILKR